MRWKTKNGKRSALRRHDKSGNQISLLRAWPFWLIVALLVIPSGAALWRVTSEQRLRKNGDSPPAELTAGVDLRVPASQLTTGKLLVFEYDHREASRFVLRREEDGRIEVALAACAVCYPRTQQAGYVLGGAVMCGTCRQPMSMPAAAEQRSNQCELVRVPYNRNASAIVVNWQVLMRALHKLSPTNQGQSQGPSQNMRRRSSGLALGFPKSDL